MKKIRVLTVVVLFMLIGETDTIENKMIQDLAEQEIKLCQILKDQNKQISVILDKILDGLDPKQESYKEVKKFRGLVQEAEKLLEEIEKMIDDIPSQKNHELLIKNLLEIDEKAELVSIIQEFLHNSIWTIFAPWLEKKPLPEIITRAFVPHSQLVLVGAAFLLTIFIL